MSLLDRFRELLGSGLPAGFAGRLEAEEHVVAVAPLSGRAAGHLVVTNRGIWLPRAEPARRIGWHLISKATWAEGTLTIVEATAEERDGAFLLTDGPPQRFPLAEPGKVPKAVHERVTGSIVTRERGSLPDGREAWILRRKVPGRDGTIIQIRPDR